MNILGTQHGYTRWIQDTGYFHLLMNVFSLCNLFCMFFSEFTKLWGASIGGKAKPASRPLASMLQGETSQWGCSASSDDRHPMVSEWGGVQDVMA